MLKQGTTQNVRLVFAKSQAVEEQCLPAAEAWSIAST